MFPHLLRLSTSGLQVSRCLSCRIIISRNVISSLPYIILKQKSNTLLPLEINFHRTYAKGRSKGGSKNIKNIIQLDDETLSAIDDEKFSQQTNDVLERLRGDFIDKLSLRSNISSLENLLIETPDGKMPLIQLASVVQKSASLYIVDVTTVPMYASQIRDCILKSGLNMTVQQEGTTLYLPMPMITKERREMHCKSAKMLAEKAKVALRDIQNRHLRTLKKSNRSKDEVFTIQQHIMNVVKNKTVEIDRLLQEKQKILME